MSVTVIPTFDSICVYIYKLNPVNTDILVTAEDIPLFKQFLLLQNKFLSNSMIEKSGIEYDFKLCTSASELFAAYNLRIEVFHEEQKFAKELEVDR